MYQYIVKYLSCQPCPTLSQLQILPNDGWIHPRKMSGNRKAADSHQQAPIIRGHLIFYTEQVKNCAPGFCKAAELSAIHCAITASNSARWCLNSSSWLLIFCRLTGSIFWGESGMHNWTLYFYKPKWSGSIFTTSRSQLNASGPWYWTLYS